MGYAYRGSCFPSQAEAAGAECRDAYPVTGIAAVGLTKVSCVGVDGTSLLLSITDADGVAGPSLTVSTVYSPCDEASLDSAPLTPGLASGAFGAGFGLVLSAYVVAWGFGVVLRFLGR